MKNSDPNPPIPSSSPSSSPITASAAAASAWLSGIVRARTAFKKSASTSSIPAETPNVAATSPAPINNKRQFRGVMFKYGPKPIQVAFKTGDYNQQVIFIGGLTDGFLATEYLEPLAVALDKEHWSLVQFLFSSSYSGYGISSLKQDAVEIDQLISYLIYKEASEGVVLLGHSTGCQDIVNYLRTKASCSRAVRAAILQAPVSDREYKATFAITASMIDLATNMLSVGRASELMPREANPDSPITAYRYHSLCSYNGDDDFFSSDFSEDQLKQKLGHMSRTPTLVIFSMGDEYVPRYVDKISLVNRLCAAMGGAEKVLIEHGTHSLSNRVEETIKGIMDFIRRDGLKWEDPWS